MCFKPVLSLFLAAAAVLFSAAGCAGVENNDRSISELANHMMVRTGAEWDGPFQPGPPHAESGFALRIDNRQVVFLKYNTQRKKMRRWLEYIDANKSLYILGIKFPAMRHGSFAMLDYEGFQPETRRKLIEAFQSF